MTSARRVLVSSAQFLAGAVLVASIGFGVWNAIPSPDVPQGWSVFRPPHDTLTLAIVQGEVWAGGPKGLFAISLDGSSPARPLAAPVALQQVTSIHVISSVAWVGHSLGLSRFDGTTWRTYDEADGLPDRQVWAARVTRDGVVWAGTERGLARLDGDRWSVLTTRDGLASDAATVLFEDEQGRLWVGNGLTFEGGLSVIVRGKVSAFDRSKLPHAMVNAIVQDAGGGVWIGTGFGSRGGACLIEADQVTILRKADGLAGEKVRSLLVDGAARVWFGSEYDGAARRSGDGWAVWKPADGLPGNEVKAMMEDGDGNVWFATENGVGRCERAVCGAQSLP